MIGRMEGWKNGSAHFHPSSIPYFSVTTRDAVLVMDTRLRQLRQTIRNIGLKSIALAASPSGRYVYVVKLGEMEAYVKAQVSTQAKRMNRNQEPMLTGQKERVLVQFK